MRAPAVSRTEVGIVGSGPSGLMLSHLLSLAGIESVVVDHRSRDEIEQPVRAGILEHDSVRLLVDSGVSDRVRREGSEHEGIELAFGGGSHRIEFTELDQVSSVTRVPVVNGETRSPVEVPAARGTTRGTKQRICAARPVDITDACRS